MPNPNELTRAEVIRAALSFRPVRKKQKWVVIVENRELPARTLVLRAAGVTPRDPTNSHQAVAILERLGFETRYCEAAERPPSESATITNNLGSIAMAVSQISRRLTKSDLDLAPRDLARNLDHYLYGRGKGE